MCQRYGTTTSFIRRTGQILIYLALLHLQIVLQLHWPIQPFWIEMFHVGELCGLEVGNCPQKLCGNLSVSQKQYLVSNGAVEKSMVS